MEALASLRLGNDYQSLIAVIERLICTFPQKRKKPKPPPKRGHPTINIVLKYIKQIIFYIYI